nr:MAG TPA: hypothetical protein [Caudoviricetes sp.]
MPITLCSILQENCKHRNYTIHLLYYLLPLDFYISSVHYLKR